MNWWRRAQQLEMGYGTGSYLDFGHDVYKDKESYEKSDPNYMWKYINGEIDIEPETPILNNHSAISRWEGTDTYSGRYDAKSKVITLSRPWNGGVRTYRDPPKTLQYQLRKAFPEAVKILVY